MNRKMKRIRRNTFETERLSEICHLFDVSRLSLFGSFLHGQESPSSDIDLLVEFDAPKSLVTLISLQNELSKEFGREVDLLTRDSISPYLRDKILDEIEPIYVKG